MTQHFPAIFENGVFRPLEQVQLAEHERVLRTVSSEAKEASAIDPAEVIRRQKESLEKLRKEMDSIPIQAPSDGLAGAEHDLILYGRQK